MWEEFSCASSLLAQAEFCCTGAPPVYPNNPLLRGRIPNCKNLFSIKIFHLPTSSFVFPIKKMWSTIHIHPLTTDLLKSTLDSHVGANAQKMQRHIQLTFVSSYYQKHLKLLKNKQIKTKDGKVFLLKGLIEFYH